MKKMSKVFALLMAGTMALSVVPTVASAEETYRVAMITDYGDITDQSFNQTTYEACLAFCEANDIDFQYFKPTDDSTASRVESVDQAVAEGYNIIVMPGYAFAGTVVETSAMYPDVKFIALDVGAGDILDYAVADYDYTPENWDVTEYYYADNVYIAIYQEELAGYLAGVAAVKLGYRHIGFLGGMAVPAVIRYGYGFVQGISDAAAELGVSDEVTVEYVYGNQFYGDSDITAYMDTWYQSNGVEVVFACGGGIYTSAAEAAAKVDGKVIGVDVDQAATIDGAYGDGMTVTSAMKGLAATVNTLLDEIINNDNWDSYVGLIQNLGMVSETPSENYVQIAESTQFNDDFTEEDYAALVASLYAGEITVNNDSTLELDEAGLAEMDITVAVNAYGNIK